EKTFGSVPDRLNAMSATTISNFRSRRTPMQRSSIIKTIKITHRYLGLFFAPAILFFAFSGAILVLGWHQTSRSSNYLPARWIEETAQIHKKQTLALPTPKPQKPITETGDDRPIPAKKVSKTPASKVVLQCFLVAMSVALIVTTFLGIIMALLYGGDWRIATVTVLLGILFPIAMTLL
ncbi:MAG TPA: hypothetical protein VGM27_24370, partial [Acidobacteriaceae bacterium]